MVVKGPVLELLWIWVPQ